jgi:hypothetical protein
MRASGACTSVEHIPTIFGTSPTADRHGAAWASLWYTLLKWAELCSGTYREPSECLGTIWRCVDGSQRRTSSGRRWMIRDQRAWAPTPVYPALRTPCMVAGARPGWEVHIALRVTSRRTSKPERSGRSRSPLCREFPPHLTAAIDATSPRSKVPKILGTGRYWLTIWNKYALQTVKKATASK